MNECWGGWQENHVGEECSSSMNSKCSDTVAVVCLGRVVRGSREAISGRAAAPIGISHDCSERNGKPLRCFKPRGDMSFPGFS